MDRTCPQCKEPLEKSEGKLDQSGHTYLPTTVWVCSSLYCEYKEFERPTPGTQPLPYYPEIAKDK